MSEDLGLIDVADPLLLLRVKLEEQGYGARDYHSIDQQLISDQSNDMFFQQSCCAEQFQDQEFQYNQQLLLMEQQQQQLIFEQFQQAALNPEYYSHLYNQFPIAPLQIADVEMSDVVADDFKTEPGLHTFNSAYYYETQPEQVQPLQRAFATDQDEEYVGEEEEDRSFSPIARRPVAAKPRRARASNSLSSFSSPIPTAIPASFSFYPAAAPLADCVPGVFHVAVIFNLADAPTMPNGIKVIKGGLPTVRKGKKRRSVCHTHQPREPLFIFMMKTQTENWADELKSGHPLLPITDSEIQFIHASMRLQSLKDGEELDDTSAITGFNYASNGSRSVATAGTTATYLSDSPTEHTQFKFDRFSSQTPDMQKWMCRQLELSATFKPQETNIVDLLEFGAQSSNVVVSEPVHLWLEYREGGDYPAARQGLYRYCVRDLVLPPTGGQTVYGASPFVTSSVFQLTNH